MWDKQKCMVHFSWCSKLPSNDSLPPCMSKNRNKRVFKKHVSWKTYHMPYSFPPSSHRELCGSLMMNILTQDMSLFHVPFMCWHICLFPVTPSHSVLLQLILEWLEPEMGRWNSPSALQSCKRMIATWLLFLLLICKETKVLFWWFLLW